MMFHLALWKLGDVNSVRPTKKSLWEPFPEPAENPQFKKKKIIFNFLSNIASFSHLFEIPNLRDVLQILVGSSKDIANLIT